MFIELTPTFGDAGLVASYETSGRLVSPFQIERSVFLAMVALLYAKPPPRSLPSMLPPPQIEQRGSLLN